MGYLLDNQRKKESRSHLRQALNFHIKTIMRPLIPRYYLPVESIQKVC